jgi:OmpA-OmpF porin, OOP family
MKKILMAVAVAGAFVAAPASAQWYAGVGVGSAKTSMGTNSFGVGATNFSFTQRDSRDTSWKLYGGYQFTANWGAELQYVDLGRYGYRLTSGANESTSGGKADSWGLAGTGTLPLGSGFSLMGKLGIARNSLSVGSTSVTNTGVTGTVSGSSTSTALLAGVGLGYNFNRNVGIRAEYENFGKMGQFNNGGGSVRGDNWAISLKYSF